MFKTSNQARSLYDRSVVWNFGFCSFDFVSGFGFWISHFDYPITIDIGINLNMSYIDVYGCLQDLPSFYCQIFGHQIRAQVFIFQQVKPYAPPLK